MVFRSVIQDNEMWYTYVLRSKKGGELYVGSTNDLERRKRQHNSGAVKSTKHRRPLVLVYYEAIPSKKRAEERERYFKTSWGKRFIRKQIGGTPVE